jgi:putative membrane protein
MKDTFIKYTREKVRVCHMSSLPILPTISTSCIVISAILVAVGWYQVKQKNINTHQKVMMWSAAFALLFFIIYMSRTIFIGNTSFGGPDHIKIYYTIFLIFHIVLATIGAIFGLVTIWLGYKNRISKHKKWGPITSVIWFFTASTGVVVYLLLYVFYKGGETTSVIKAILGF